MARLLLANLWLVLVLVEHGVKPTAPLELFSRLKPQHNFNSQIHQLEEG